MQIAPLPIFAWLERFNYRMFGFFEMFGGMLIFGTVAATYVAAC